MDTAEEAARPPSDAVVRRWLQLRLDLQRRSGEPCVDIRQWTRPPAQVLPEISAPMTLSEGHVRPQLRSYAGYMYTDDPQFLFAGIDNTKMGLREWRTLTEEIGLLMAIPEKRSLGSWSRWLGVFVVIGLGLVVVPKDKLLRASDAVRQTLSTGVEFHVYRSLCGLLEHLRAVNLKARNIMFGLYAAYMVMALLMMSL